MMPGRSLFSKTSGRSWAPGASTTWLARMCQIRCRDTPGAAGAGQVVGAVLDGDDVVGVVGAEGGGAVQDGAFGAGNQLGFDVRHPFQGRLAFDGLDQAGGRGPGQERSAQFGLVVHQHDAGAGADGFAGRGQAGGAAADDQDVGVDVLLVVLGAVLLGIQPAQAVEQFSLQAVHQGDGGGGEHGLGHVAREPGAI